MKKIIVIGIIILITALIIWGNRYVADSQSAIEITTAKVDKGEIIQVVHATGTIDPGQKQKVRTEVEGNVLEKLVKEGDKVKEKQVVLEIDKTKLKDALFNEQVKVDKLKSDLKNLKDNQGPYDLARSQDSLNRAKVELEYSYKNLTTMSRLYGQEVVTKRNYEDAERALENAKLTYEAAVRDLAYQKENFQKQVKQLESDIRVAEIELADAKRKLEKASVQAPMVGVIVEDLLKENKYVNNGAEIFTIGDLSSYLAKVKVDELDIGKIKIGQSAKITSDAFPDVKLPCHVTNIASQATRQTFAEIEVELAIDSTMGQAVKPNLSVDADIQVNQFDTVMRVPNSAVIKEEKKQYVMVINGNKASKKEVTTGVGNIDFIMIQKGLNVGDVVATKNVTRLKDGVTVKIVQPKSTLSKSSTAKSNK